MYFNLILDRDFAGPFFEHVIFAIAVLILLFGMLVLTTDDPDLKARFQLSTAGVLGSASGLLFAVILKHNQLRSTIGSAGGSFSLGSLNHAWSRARAWAIVRSATGLRSAS